MSSHSLQSSLTVPLLVGIGVALTFLALAFRITVVSWLEADFDQRLEAKARALVTLTKSDGAEVELDFAGEYMPEFELEANGEYFEIWFDSGAPLERSDSLEYLDSGEGSGEAENHLGRSDLLLLEAGEFSSSSHRDVELPDGRSGRQIEVRFIPQLKIENFDEDALEGTVPPSVTAATPVMVLAVAVDRQSLEGRKSALDLTLTLSTVGVLALLLGLVSSTIAKGLRPLHDFSQEVELFDANSLEHRFEETSLPDELGPIASGLNRLIERLESSFVRERRLSSDLAHELRTPIAELRNLSEVGGRWPGDRKTAEEFFKETRELAIQMEATVATLLELARLDSGSEQVRLDVVDLNPLIDICWGHALAQKPNPRNHVDEGTHDKTPRLVLDLPDDLRVFSDPQKLEMMLSNLIGNAVLYSPDGGVVECCWKESATGFSLEIGNTATDLEPGDETVLFDRFWRKDKARSRSGSLQGGLGIGLSLVERLCFLLELEAAARFDADSHWLTLVVRGFEVAESRSRPRLSG